MVDDHVHSRPGEPLVAVGSGFEPPSRERQRPERIAHRRRVGAQVEQTAEQHVPRGPAERIDVEDACHPDPGSILAPQENVRERTMGTVLVVSDATGEIVSLVGSELVRQAPAG
jgi:hypothetical protein